ncbi:MAG: DUF2066 domain-containing protein [Alcanivoracaceae bacterium]|nr:DUF2066 domain-containing protein [Alcanivoracaceae bacterium]
MWIIKTIMMILLVLNTAQAVVIDVTTTSILVEDTDARDPLKLKQAFAQILANNTGEDILDILQNPVFFEANISQGIKRSYFETIESKYLPTDSIHKYWFHVVMQESYIRGIIKQAGFSILPHNRKELMLWLVKETDTKEPISAETTNNIARFSKSQELYYGYKDEVLMYWFKHWAQALGLVVVFPSIDERDMLFVRPRSIKNLSFEAIEQTSNRYQLDQTLLVYVRKTADFIKLRSGFTINGDDMTIKHFQQPIAEEGVVLYSLMADIAQKYSQKFKISSDHLQDHTVRVEFEDIENYDEITTLRRYLTNLSVIRSFEIVSASVGELVMNVDLIINRVEFLKIIARDRVLLFNQNSPVNRLQFTLEK